MARYAVEPAPDGLAVVHELLNTAGSEKLRQPDLLVDLNHAGGWLQELRSVADGLPAETLDLTESDLNKIRELRSSIAASISGREASPMHATVSLGLGAHGTVDVDASMRPSDWLTGSVMLETLVARRSGEWSRLKICGNPDCHVSFYDRSKNRSGVWHDVRVCGNAINLRASKQRRKSSAQFR
jgi:predicted RNA-binding Zn ribbon-like protein